MVLRKSVLTACGAAILGLVMTAPEAQLAAQSRQPGISVQAGNQLTAAEMQQMQQAFQAEQQRKAALASIGTDKAGFVANLMTRWSAEIGDTEKALDGFRSAFMAADAEKLFEVSQAQTWATVVDILAGLSPSLGSPSSDLVFNPLPPCRAMDTRLGAGAWAGPKTGGSQLSFYVTDALNANGHTQGGLANCGFPFAVGTGVALNITVVPLSGSGDLRIFPHGGSLPNASIINFSAGVNLANAANVQIALADATNDLTIQVDGATSVHIIVDVMGYFAASHATALQNAVVTTENASIPNGSSYSLDTPVCPAGYTVTGGGYNWFFQATGNWIWQSGPLNSPPTQWRLRGYNQTGGAVDMSVYAVCARVPGR
jgi:hypothetical protein